MNLTQICRDESLYGHALLRFPHQVGSFSRGAFSLYDQPDPGSLVVENDYLIAKFVRYRKGPIETYRTELLGEKFICNLIEFLGRRVLGSLATIFSFTTLPPIGFTVKILHFGARQTNISLQSHPSAEKVRQIWNNADLSGHGLTSAPLKCYKFATAPLRWHLRADGTDRRSYIAEFRPNRAWVVIHESEYELVPFELFEFIYRRIFGGCLTLATAILSPFGLAAKTIHLSTQSPPPPVSPNAKLIN